MIRSVILHIGMHSTGTTSFQAFLYENETALAAQGFYVYRPVNQGSNAAELSAAARGLLDIKDVLAIRNNLDQICSLSHQTHLLASAESLSLLSNKSQIKALKNLFPSYVDAFIVILVVRDKNIWLKRIFENKVFLQNQSESDEPVTEPPTYDSLIRLYQESFTLFKELDYQEAGMIEKLCSVMRVDYSGLDTRIRYHHTTQIKRFLNARFPFLLRAYKSYIAHTPVGKLKRYIFNRRIV